MVRQFFNMETLETQFYDEQNYTNPGPVTSLKRNLTLDLNQTKNMMKKQRLNSDAILSSPDLNMCKLGTPEIERFITQHGIGLGATPTPSQDLTLLFPKGVTKEQEKFAMGFTNVLNELQLRNGDSVEATLLENMPNLSNNLTYTNLDQQNNNQMPGHHLTLSGGYLDNIVIKDEPQTVPVMTLGNSPQAPSSPIDMESQERIKLERKRARNRMAASKCRRRKLERISKLEQRVKELKSEHTDLIAIIKRLKEHVCSMKEEVMKHLEAGCQMVSIPHQYMV